MVNFNEKHLDFFLGVLRKYMQVRGNLSQKDLAEQIGVGISTMSRFLSKKVGTIDGHLVAKLVAHLNIPLHEIVEFVEEGSTEAFKGLVQFYKENPPQQSSEETPAFGRGGKSISTGQYAPELGDFEEGARQPGEGQRPGYNQSGNIYGHQNERRSISLKDKLEGLTPRQKAYLSDFLDLDMEGKDLVVDLGNSLFRYFRQKGVEF